MSEKSNRPALKWLLISSFGIVLLGMAPVVWYVSLPDDFYIGRELQARGFKVAYDLLERHPVFVIGNNLDITPEDCQLIGQLPYLEGLHFSRSNMSDLNWDDIGNCQKLFWVRLDGVTQLSMNDLKTLAVFPIRRVDLYRVDLEDSDLEVLMKLAKLETLSLPYNAGITDVGLEHLEKISSLRNLDLYGTSVTQEGIEEFQKKRPKITIITDWTDPIAAF